MSFIFSFLEKNAM